MVTATPHEDVEAAYGQPPDMVASIIESVMDYGRACADELPDSQRMWLDDIRERLEGLQYEAYADGRRDEREALQGDVQKALELMRSLLLGRGELPSSDVINATVTDAINALRNSVRLEVES